MNRIENIFGDEIEKTVFISDEQLHDRNVKVLYGKFYEDTNIYNVFPAQLSDQGEYLCNVLEQADTPEMTGLCAIFSNEQLTFFYDGKKIKVESYGLYQSIFSRNKGILETDKMAQKRAVILGCGSVGSLVAMELARAGVGYFLLCDADIVEYHNVCRHQCGITDVGDLKVNALSRKLQNINPNIKIVRFEGIVQNLPKSTLDEFCVEPNNFRWLRR